MDLIKIGKYIAEKRKALGLTQKQLAEKLNMSDKSVSKWERGISQWGCDEKRGNRANQLLHF